MLGVTVWSWAGRTRGSRWWVWRTSQGRGDLIPLCVLPFLGLLLLFTSIVNLIGPESVAYMWPFFLLPLIVAVIGVIRPRWWGPKWYREYRKAQEDDPFNGPGEHSR